MKKSIKVVRDYWFDWVRLMVSCYLITLMATKAIPVEKKIAMVNALLALWAYREEKKVKIRKLIDDAEEKTQTQSAGLAGRPSGDLTSGDSK